MELALDNAELADLNHCIDQMLVDGRCALGLEVHSPQPLRRGNTAAPACAGRANGSPSAAFASVVIVGALVSLLPLRARS